MATKNEVKSMIEDSERNIINIISGSGKIQNDKIDQLISKIDLINERMDKLEKNTTILESKFMIMEENLNHLKKENQELKDSLQFTQEEMIEKKFACIQNDVYSEMDRIYENHNILKEKNRKLEDRTRRCNLRIDGIDENLHESWEDTEKKVSQLFENTLELKDKIEIERAHRMINRSDESNNNRDDNQNRPRTIILKLLRYKDKELVLNNCKKLKGTGIFVYEDFSNETNEIRKGLKIQMKKEREKGNYCVINYDKLIVKKFRNPKILPASV